MSTVVHSGRRTAEPVTISHVHRNEPVTAPIKPNADLPPGSWDSHVHVVDEERFPLHPLHPYRPKTATLDNLRDFHNSLGVERACLVAFSVYHTDNSCLLDALRRFKGRGRAVACIDPYVVADGELQQLHDAGVRGVRVNMKTTSSKLDVQLLKDTCERVRPYSWAVQLYVALWQVAELAPVVPSLGVPIILDHIGSPDAGDGPGREQMGYREFKQLLRSGQIWVKLSGTYRFPTLPDLDDYILDVLRTAPDRLVWGSDWPHSGGVEKNPGGDRSRVQDYRRVDDLAWILTCKALCRRVEKETGLDMVKKIWVDNPKVLWQV